MKKQQNKKSLYTLVLSAIFAALIAVMTAYIKVPTGINSNYIHVGDSLIYLAACVLPTPFAMLAAAIGGFLADILAGAAIWAPATAIIKALNALPFALICASKYCKKKNKILNVATFTMSIVSGIITIVGYFVAEAIMFSLESALAGLALCFIQPLGSAIVFYILAIALDKANFKNQIEKFTKRK